MIWILKVILQELFSIEKKLKNEDLWVYYPKEVDQEGWGCSLCVSHSLPYFSCLYPLPFTMFVLYPISFPMGILVRLVGCYGLPSLLIRSALFASRLSLSASPRIIPLRLASFGSRLALPGYSFGCSLLAGSPRASSLVPIPILFPYLPTYSLPCGKTFRACSFYSLPVLVYSLPVWFIPSLLCLFLPGWFDWVD